MRNVLITIFSLLFVFVSKAQVAELHSLQYATVWKDCKGSFIEAKEWIGQQTRIDIDLSERKVRIFSKGMFDRDTFELKKEINRLEKSQPPIWVDDTLISRFSGVDVSGKVYALILKLCKDEFKMQNGELRVEYLDMAQIYKLKAFRRTSRLNKS